jgi:hypothetical protein
MAAHPRPFDHNLPQMVGTSDSALLGYSEFFFGGASNLGTTTRQQFLAVLAPLFVLLALMDKSNRNRLTAVRLLLLASVLMILGRIGNINHFAIWPRPLGGGGRYSYLPFVLAFWAPPDGCGGCRSSDPRAAFCRKALGAAYCSGLPLGTSSPRGPGGPAYLVCGSSGLAISGVGGEGAKIRPVTAASKAVWSRRFCWCVIR